MANIRKSNFELLRVISMLMIVVYHYVYHGGLLWKSSSLINSIGAQFLAIGGNLGVTCFVLISAYFLVDGKFKIKNIVLLCFELSFYSLFWIAIKYLISGDIVIVEVVKSIFSPVYCTYWFPSAYIGMYLFSPVLNIIIGKVEKKLYKVVIILTILLSVVDFIFPGATFLYSDVLWFVYLYFVAAWLKRCPSNGLEKKAYVFIVFSVLCMWSSSVVFNYIGGEFEIDILIERAFYFSKKTSPFIVLAGVGMFMCFNKMQIQSKKINFFARYMFAVYLVHDNCFTRDLLWKQLLNTTYFYDKNILMVLFHIFLSLISILVITMIVETIRKKIELQLVNLKFIDKIFCKLDNWYVE